MRYITCQTIKRFIRYKTKENVDCCASCHSEDEDYSEGLIDSTPISEEVISKDRMICVCHTLFEAFMKRGV